MAVAEIAVDQPIYSRLALILIDNATELLIHRSCEQYAAHGTERIGLRLVPRCVARRRVITWSRSWP
ncbi:hypothetical protein CQ13_36360 [Bradyrhizobium retamae]|uniref:Uncharacterized protein n=1 Tax=Bradyrhizobium retamae TaxID=1300035 RepID=A0A0R3MHH8_9BRAD|nr:hypothetical protein CQ13_36360 [Bradyrhizobium retamae]